MMKKITAILISAAAMLQACGVPGIPQEYASSPYMPEMFPDYAGTTMPCNIAPPNFQLEDTSIYECAARISGGTVIETGARGRDIQIPISEWKNLCAASAGDSISIEVFARKNGGQWTKYRNFGILISPDEIDPYISYRLIEPSYSLYDNICLAQRHTENFDESIFYSTKPTYGQCVNCHSYQNYSTRNMLYHKRGAGAGTVIRIDGEDKVVDLKRDFTISPGVYPAWHPTENLIAFSTDKTHQIFHSLNPNKVEVYDSESDLILYDADTDEVSVIADSKQELEVFPAWTPCGKYLYYCSARVCDSTFSGIDIRDYQSLKYSIMRRSFDPQKRIFGSPDTVYASADMGKSCTLPRISPDGRKLIFSEGAYGCFHIWHNDSEIRIMDLETGEREQLTAVNGPHSDSYPTFSSNGRWIMLASRRIDGNYSRIFIAHYDGQNASKPFLLPQLKASHNTMRMRSYNRPEFMTDKVE